MRVDQLSPAPVSVEPLQIPAALQDSVLRHQTHLIELIANLRTAGVDEATIDASIQSLIASYSAELTVAIRAMIKEAQRG